MRKKNFPNRKKDLGPLIVLVIGLVILFFVKRHRDAKKEMLVENTILQEEVEKPRAPTKESAVAPPERKNSFPNMKVGENVFRVPEKESQTLSILVQPKALGCGMGDFNLISQVAGNPKDKDYLLELKAMNGDQAESQRMSLQDLQRKLPIKFHYKKLLRNSAKAEAFGLFICHDTPAKGRCSDKTPVGSRGFSAVSADGLKNKIYYFQLLIRNHLGFHIVPVKRWDKKSFAEIKKIFNGDVGLDGQEFERVRQMISQVSSVPANVSGVSVEVVLPYLDPECQVSTR